MKILKDIRKINLFSRILAFKMNQKEQNESN
jgi:hypothetical protein